MLDPSPKPGGSGNRGNASLTSLLIGLVLAGYMLVAAFTAAGGVALTWAGLAPGEAALATAMVGLLVYVACLNIGFAVRKPHHMVAAMLMLAALLGGAVLLGGRVG